MIRNLKTLGVALCAVLALTAVAASAASAAGSYTASDYGVSGATGTATSPFGNDTFITAVGTVECAAHFEGTLTETSSSLTVKPTYTGCKFAGFNATVNMGKCDYNFTTPTQELNKEEPPKPIPDAWLVGVDVVCNEGSVITISAGPCVMTVGPQGPLNSVTVTNNTVAGDVSVQSNISKQINYTVTVDNFGCPFAGTGPKTEASYIQHSAITFDAVTPEKSEIHIG
jgi:hypothetical protein